MVFRLECGKCGKELFRVKYDMDIKQGTLMCAACGQSYIYENLLNPKKTKIKEDVKNGVLQQKTSTSPASTN